MTTETVTSRCDHRRRRAVPLLRQPREVPPVRHHDEREGGRRGADRRRARSPQADASGVARVRRRDGQRDRARQRVARSAPPDADRAVRGRRQGSQHGGHPVDAVDPARSLLGAPRDRGRAHQHVLRRGSPAVSPQRRRAGPGQLVGGPSRRHDLVRVPATGRSTRERARRGVADGHEPEDRQSRVRQAVGARAVPQGPCLLARRPDPAQHRWPAGLQVRPRARRPAVPIAHRCRDQGQDGARSDRPGARPRRPPGGGAVDRARPGHGDRAPDLARRTSRSRHPGTR